MRTLFVALTVCGLVALLGACSDIDEDPIGDKCTEKCTITSTHPCYTYKHADGVPAQQKCLNDCKSLSGDAEKKHWPGCGLCVAETFTYSVNTAPPCDKDPSASTCCYGRKFTGPSEKPCISRCNEPDGGAAY